MKENKFKRTDSLFSLCGLNCGLCPMSIRGECGGCFTDSPCYPTCPIAPCSVEHGNVEYCFECSEYPCKRYDGIDLHDSLISHRNQKKDLEKAKRMGIETYKEKQRTKKKIIDRLLNEYDDGRKDVFFCLAVNLLELGALNEALDMAGRLGQDASIQEKTLFVERQLYACAENRGISLELRR